MATNTRRGNDRVNAESKQARYRGKGPSGVSKWVTREVLQGYFDLPLGKASKELGVSTTIVKRLCRKLSITRWPYRQLASLDKSIAKLHVLLETTQESDIDKIQDNIRHLRNQRESLIQDPMPLSPYVLPVRIASPQPSPHAELPTISGGTKHKTTAAGGLSHTRTKDTAVLENDHFDTSGRPQHVACIPRSSGAAKGNDLPKGSRFAARVTGASSTATAAVTTIGNSLYPDATHPEIGERALSDTIPTGPSSFKTPKSEPHTFTGEFQAPSGTARSSMTQLRTPAHAKRVFDETRGDGYRSPVGNQMGPSAISPATSRSRVSPISCPRKRACLNRASASDNEVNTTSTLSDLLLEAQPVMVPRTPPNKRDWARNDFTIHEYFSKLEEEKLRQPRVFAAAGISAGRSRRVGTQYDLPLASGNASGGQVIAGGGLSAGASTCRSGRGNSRPDRFTPSLDVASVTAIDVLHRQPSCHAVNGDAGLCAVKTEKLYSASETTASMSSGDDDRDRSNEARKTFCTGYGPTHPFTRSVTSPLESLAGSIVNESFPTSPLLEPLPLWDTSSAEGKEASDATLGEICLECPFELDIPEVIYPSTAADSSWSATTGTASCSSFYCNDELATTPSGLVGDGW